MTIETVKVKRERKRSVSKMIERIERETGKPVSSVTIIVRFGEPDQDQADVTPLEAWRAKHRGES
jgi:hypothetical protein